MKVQEYLSEDGSSPYQKWFQKLDTMAAAKITVAKARLELGNTSNIKWFDGIGEYRIDWGPGYRIYLVQEGKQLIILLGGGNKQSQQTDIERAKKFTATINSANKPKKPPLETRKNNPYDVDKRF